MHNITFHKLNAIYLIISLMCFSTAGMSQPLQNKYEENFDSITNMQLPAGWKADATNATKIQQHWKVVADVNAPVKNNILTIGNLNGNSSNIFNLLWTNRIEILDAELELHIRANSGRMDQGGGLMWRVKDANNYYIARHNPLENNFRLYYVKDGQRTQLASSDTALTPVGNWVHIRIVHRGNRIQGWFNNTFAWDIIDSTFPNKGGIGLWTKADAASSFDNLIVRGVSEHSQELPTP